MAQKLYHLLQQIKTGSLTFACTAVPQPPLAGRRVLNQQSILVLCEIFSNVLIFFLWRNIWELYKGYNHCASRRVLMIHHVVLYDVVLYVPSMKTGVYKIKKDPAGYGEIHTASCQCILLGKHHVLKACFIIVSVTGYLLLMFMCQLY